MDLQYYKQTCEAYLNDWDGEEAGMTSGEAALGALVAAGGYRQRAKMLPRCLQKLDDRRREQIVRDACQEAKRSGLPSHIGRLLKKEFLEPEELEEFEEIVVQLAELEAMVGAGAELVRHLAERQDLVDALAVPKVRIAEIVAQLERAGRPDIVSVASRLAWREWAATEKVPAWLARWRQWDQELSSSSLAQL